ncbi:MAG TPA: hypothetical protein PKE12_10105 [Kiritimatiellia bacterium]|nr:hypothetical protein [Kiritimatiellia bacterium]
MAALNTFSPAWGEPSDWEAAFEQVDGYLRAHRLGGRWRRAQLAADIVETVAAAPPADPGASPVTLAIEATDRAMAGWFRGLLPEFAALDDRRSLSAGRLAYWLCDGYARWPDAFLQPNPPDEFVRALHGAVLKAGPELRKGRMIPRRLAWGAVATWAGTTLDVLDRRPLLKAAITWLLVIALAAYLFWYTR